MTNAIPLRRLPIAAVFIGCLFTAPQALACLPARGHVGRDSIRGVHVGATAHLPPKAVSAGYCVDQGGDVKFAVDREMAVVLVLSTAPGDRIRSFAPGTRASQLPALRHVGESRTADLYRIASSNQVLVGVTNRHVRFIAAADRLLLESRGRLSYWLARLGF